MTTSRKTSQRTMRRRMGVAALIVSGGVLISRLLGVLREVVFAGLLGSDAVTDQYVAAFRVPDFANYLLAGGFLSITFIPIFSRYLAQDEEEAGWRAFAAIMRPLAVAITALVVAAMAAAPAVIEWIYPDFTTEQITTTVRLTRIVLPAQIFFVTGALFTAVQYTKGAFVVPTLAPILYNVGIITGGVAWAAATGTADPEGFIWGALAGAFVGNFAVQWWGARRVGMRVPLGTGWSHPAIREYIAIAFPLMIGQSIVVLDETFMSVFGDLVGDGVQTQLQYARRTMFVPVGVIAQAAGVATYPFLARLFAEDRHEALADTVQRALRYVVVLSMGAGGLLAALSVPTIRTLFERGAFEASDTTGAATALFFYALAVPVWGVLQVLTRGFYARREMWVPVVAGTAATVVAVPVYFGLQRAFGIKGVAFASTVALALYTIALAVVWYRRTGTAHLHPVVDSAARSVPLVVFGGIAAWAAARGIDAVISTEMFIGALTALVAGAAAFAAVAYWGGALLYDLERRSLRPAADHSGLRAGRGGDKAE